MRQAPQVHLRTKLKMTDSPRAAVLYEFDSGGAILFTEEHDIILATPQRRHLFPPWPDVRIVRNAGMPNSVAITEETMDKAERAGLSRIIREWPTKEHRVLHGGLLYTFFGFFIPDHMTWFVFGKPKDRLAP